MIYSEIYYFFELASQDERTMLTVLRSVLIFLRLLEQIGCEIVAARSCLQCGKAEANLGKAQSLVYEA